VGTGVITCFGTSTGCGTVTNVNAKEMQSATTIAPRTFTFERPRIMVLLRADTWLCHLDCTTYWSDKYRDDIECNQDSSQSYHDANDR